MRDLHILVLGLGVSGLAMARWCSDAGARVTVLDTRDSPANLIGLQTHAPNARFISHPLGVMSASAQSELTATIERHFGAVSGVMLSPGLNPSLISPVTQAYTAVGVWTTGELGLFERALNELATSKDYKPIVLAITGTNGKTTVTSLTQQLLMRAGIVATAAGNIGPSLLDTLRHCVAEEQLPQAWVLELSSFQLHASTLKSQAATVLNVSEDHLDWHASLVEYAAAKAKIFDGSATMVLNRDDATVMAMLPRIEKGRGKGDPARTHVTFGTDLPTRAGDWGLETVNGMTWLVRAHPSDETRKRRSSDAAEIQLQRLMPADALRIRGRHNANNALAALALAATTGAPLAAMLYGIREYRGEPHRVESVATIHGVEYFDDSKGTNVGATLAAIKGLGAERKLVLILGGVGKGQNFSPLADAVAQHARGVILIGAAANEIRDALTHKLSQSVIAQASTMNDAVKQAAEIAQSGDAVLLSPACASFDMFDGYVHRAQVFVSAVQALATEAGDCA